MLLGWKQLGVTQFKVMTKVDERCCTMVMVMRLLNKSLYFELIKQCYVGRHSSIYMLPDFLERVK